jgi:flagellar biosynthetic protein FliR
MIMGLSEAIQWLQQDGQALFLVFIRAGALMALLPAFGERLLPMRIRLALTLTFALLTFPLARDVIEQAAQGVGWTLLIAAEVVAGLALGILFRLFVVALQIAGGIAANVTSLSQIFGGTVSDPQPAMATLLVLAGLALATSAGLHVKVTMVLTESYLMLPPGQLPSGSDIASWGSGSVAYIFDLAFSLAIPFVIGAMIYNLALGAINRAMPQLMVAFVGAPLITGAGLVLLLFTAPVALAVWADAFDRALMNPMAPR